MKMFFLFLSFTPVLFLSLKFGFDWRIAFLVLWVYLMGYINGKFSWIFNIKEPELK